MLLSGLLTCTMLQGLFDPRPLLVSTFGKNIEGNLAEIITRNWATLIGLMGIMLIYGAFVPAVRKFCLVIAGISKMIFIILILSLGKPYLEYGAGIAVILDSIMIVLFVAYILIARTTSKGSSILT